MLHLYYLGLCGLLLFLVLGAGLWTARWTRLPLGVSLGVGILALCLGAFFTEHFVGLGRLGWTLIPLSLAAGWILWRDGRRLKEEREVCFALGAGFFYVLTWRYGLPNIDGNTERLPDLSFVVNYMQGERLPPPDLWYPPYRLNHYYSFQHYGAGLLGRVLGQEPGVACQLAYCLVAGLAMAAAADLVRAIRPPGWARALVLAVFLVGGTGASPFTPFMIKDVPGAGGGMVSGEKTYDSMRFVGGTTFYDDSRLSPFGLAIKRYSIASWTKPVSPTREEVPEMPMETFSYVVELGDYHAPLGGFWLFALMLAAAARLRANPRETASAALLGATLPATMATNTWNFPLQVFFTAGVLGLLWWRTREPRDEADSALPPARPHWAGFFAGALAATFLLLPFFRYFLTLNIGNGSPLRLVSAISTKAVNGYFTPPLLFMMVFWPVLVVALGHLFSARRLGKLHALFWLAMLALVEVVFVDDIYAGSAERFNTTLKWWPWVFNGTLLTLAASNLARPSRWVRWSTAATLALLLTFTLSLGRYFVGTLAALPKRNVGQLDGAGWLRNDPPVRTALEFLIYHPHGVILESPDNMAFCQVGAFSVFSQKPTVLGWASHEQLWRGYQTDTYDRYLKIKQFYAGEMADPLAFLEAHDVRYILWLPRDNAAKEALAKLTGQLAGRYYWNEFYRANEYAVGIWSRRDPGR